MCVFCDECVFCDVYLCDVEMSVSLEGVVFMACLCLDGTLRFLLCVCVLDLDGY